MENIKQTFLTIQNKLKQRIGEVSFDSWLNGLSFDNFSSGSLTLSLPTQFSADYVRRNYINDIETTFKEYFDDIKTINIKVKTNVKTTKIKVANDQNKIITQQKQNTTSEPSWFSEGMINDYFTFENFCTGESNQLAYAVAHKVAEANEKLYNPFFLYANVGLGKTHLLHSIAHHIRKNTPQRRVMYTSIQKFSESFVRSIKAKEAYLFKEQFNGIDVLLIDDFQFIDGKKSFQQEFLHILNDFISSGRQIVVSSNRPLNVLGLLPALKSRLISGLISDIIKPEKELRRKIIDAKSILFGAPLHSKTIDFLTDSLTSNIREIEGSIRRILAHSELTNRILSIKDISKILFDIINPSKKLTNLQTILEKASSYFGVSVSEIMGKSRTKRIVYARRIVMFLTSKLTDLSLSDIGRKMGDKDHSTVSHAIRAITEKQKITPQLFDDIEGLETILKTI